MADDARDDPDSTTAASGKVVGYEMSVVCPKCGYNTDPVEREASQSETVICGEDAPGSDVHGCGRELSVGVQVVDQTPAETNKGEPLSEELHRVAELIAQPRGDDPVVRIRPQFDYLDVQGKIGKGSSALVFADTGYVISGVATDIDELAEDETRVWLSTPDELMEAVRTDESQTHPRKDGE
jgi:hypothetical protein